jgi:hypothetical protein
MTSPPIAPSKASANGDRRPVITPMPARARPAPVETHVEQPNPLTRGRVWALSIVFWTLWGFYSANQTALFIKVSGRDPVEFAELLRGSLASAWVWALCTPVILWLAQRFRIERGNWRTRLPLHLAASAVVLLLDVAATYLVRIYLNGAGNINFLGLLLYYIDYAIAFYFVIVAIKHALDYYGWYRERQVQAAHLEHQLTKAQLQVLKMQLQPHFLFNTLNAYLEIEQTRFRDRLEVRMEIDPDALDARVPNLILQPLVENAIKHGTAPRAAAGLIEIFAARRDNHIVVEVRDNGGGLAADVGTFREGVGLRNTRARLRQLYGPAHRFELRNRTGGGAIVNMVIP